MSNKVVYLCHRYFQLEFTFNRRIKHLFKTHQSDLVYLPIHWKRYKVLLYLHLINELKMMLTGRPFVIGGIT